MGTSSVLRTLSGSRHLEHLGPSALIARTVTGHRQIDRIAHRSVTTAHDRAIAVTS